MNRKNINCLVRIIISAVLLGISFFINADSPTKFVCFAAIYLLIGYDILWRAIRNIFSGQVFDENFLMTVATIGAFCIGEYAESVEVMLFYQLGELFQRYAVGRSRRSIAKLMEIRPEYANLEKDGSIIQVSPEEVNIDDIIVIKPGERVPLDGTVISGNSFLDTSAITGESTPKRIGENDEIVSGCINQSGVLQVRVTREFENSTVAKILELVENAASKKSKAENFITKFARIYTPAVVFSALALAVIPPLFAGSWNVWLHRALIFLVISCPCALVISVPLSFFGGIGGASRQGILIKGSNYLEALSKISTVVFDKTGTLTKGNFKVTEISPQKISKDELLRLAALVESFSKHPIALSVADAYGKPVQNENISDAVELAGRGVSAKIDGVTVHAGNEKLMREIGIDYEKKNSAGTVVHIACGGEYNGFVVISDEIKENAHGLVENLVNFGINKIVMLTGDCRQVCESVAGKIGIKEAYYELLPADKVDIVDRLIKDKPKGTTVAFVGDGINDAPVLSRADIGIAMGKLGADAAVEAADIVFMDDNPNKLLTAVSIARRTIGIAKQNIVFALGVKALVLILGALGAANMQAAVFADVGVSVIAILNAMRALCA